jgi:hypothetical protein
VSSPLRDLVAATLGEGAARWMELSEHEKAKVDAENEQLLLELEAEAEQDAYMRQWISRGAYQGIH